MSDHRKGYALIVMPCPRCGFRPLNIKTGPYTLRYECVPCRLERGEQVFVPYLYVTPEAIKEFLP